MNWNVYLSGEIHTDWRQQLRIGCKAHNLLSHLRLLSQTIKPAMVQVMFWARKIIIFGVITNQRKSMQ